MRLDVRRLGGDEAVRARRTVLSNFVFRLAGGTEDNDLWVERKTDDGGNPVISSTWVPTDDERRQIANGANIELVVWGQGHPPVMVRTTDMPLGKAP